MKKANTKWVLGHKVTLHDTSGDYDLAFGETPAGVPGPPPHLHENFTESFLITEGEMEFFVNGKVIVLKAGESINLPQNTLHTFSNKSDSACKWVNIHSPKGFRQFFETVGISEDTENSQQNSVSEAIINEVMGTAANYDMLIKI
ncbi:cupin domain-containing protein [Flavobacteriaceae bacterium XHP0103]|uniref:cupin domain-containing protein n=1 Tax=Marixanthotalea marina TaxID=2844359 RepID=UPI002989C7EF|nr:cupin domain-containing protein [Marixanthotalea marina]MBU3820715.1 cupin domain-containing protein [Marixanthotalea marina]